MDWSSEENRNNRAAEYIYRKERQKKIANMIISYIIGTVMAILFILLYFELGY